MDRISRRSFLAHAATGAATFLVLPPAARGASDRVVLAVAGTGGQGRNHARGFNGMDDAAVAAVCDVDAHRRAQAAQQARRKDKEPKPAEDFRTLLDDKSIDAVAIATPDHWHAPITVLACQAGKDVYVEKPCCHNIREGRLMVQAARKYKRIVQHGTQNRSGDAHVEAIALLRGGKIGKVLQAKAINNQRRRNIGRRPDAKAPGHVNYDLWLGPAPARPFNPNRFHYNWHWFWDYGTGDIGNDGIHQLDVARWGLGVHAPTRIAGAAGKYFFDDDQETPDTYLIAYEFDGCTLLYEQRDWAPYTEHGFDNGCVFYGTDGCLEITPRRGYRLLGKGGKLLVEKRKKNNYLGDHQRHFIACVKTRTRSRADVEIAHRSALLAHLGNIAYRVGHDLAFDPKTERFRSDDANKLLTRVYRAPYAIPDPV